MTRALHGVESKGNLPGALGFRGKVKDGGGCLWQRSRTPAFISPGFLRLAGAALRRHHRCWEGFGRTRSGSRMLFYIC